jgi:L,D-transpeptidase ErfK/SrfK
VVAVETPYAEQPHHTSPRKAVDWVQHCWRQTRGSRRRRLWFPLLLGACGACWNPGVWAAESNRLPQAQPSVADEQEPGAAALLDANPLQVGLKEHGFPEAAGGGSPEAAGPEAVDGTRPAPASAPSAPTPSAPAQPPKAAAPAPLAPSRLLILDRRHRLLRVLDNGREVRRYPVAVGMPGWETPVGTFKVIEKTANPTWEHPANGHLLPPGPENPLGSRWIGFYRDCRGRSGFNGQEHLVVRGCVTAGFHGTPNRSSVGRAVSHGCVRLFDEHAKELFDLVSLGTPVKVLP